MMLHDFLRRIAPLAPIHSDFLRHTPLHFSAMSRVQEQPINRRCFATIQLRWFHFQIP